MTKRQCKQACFDRPWCVGASYWEDTYICHLITAHDEHGYITYNITYDSSVNVVHMYKGPYQGKLFSVRRLVTPDRLSSILYKGDNLCVFLFAFLPNNPFLKEVISKKKHIVTRGQL